MRMLLVIVLAMSAVLLRAQESPTTHSRRGIELGSIENGTYLNPAFGFQYKVPFGWVDRTEQMRDPAADSSKSILLLATFERPPEAKDDSVNSAVVITAESTSAYPGLKTAADYFVPLSDIATSKGFSVTNEPYYFSVGSRRVVRGDFSKKVDAVTMYQSSIVVLEKGYFVSFTFLGGGEDEVNESIENLSFLGAGAKRMTKAK